MSFITYFIFKVLVFTGLDRVFRDDMDKAINANPKIFTFRKKYKRTGISAIVFSVFFLSLGFFSDSNEMLIGVILLGLLSGLIGVYLLLGYRNYKVVVNDEALWVYNYLGTKNQIKWNEIEDVKLEINFSFIKIISKYNITKIPLELYFIEKLVNTIQRETGLKIYNKHKLKKKI